MKLSKKQLAESRKTKLTVVAMILASIVTTIAVVLYYQGILGG